MGTPPMSLAIDAHNCIMVGSRSTEYKGCGVSPRQQVPRGLFLHESFLSSTVPKNLNREDAISVPTCRQASAVLDAVQDASRGRSQCQRHPGRPLRASCRRAGRDEGIVACGPVRPLFAAQVHESALGTELAYPAMRPNARYRSR
jgi:hypothetical protein